MAETQQQNQPENQKTNVQSSRATAAPVTNNGTTGNNSSATILSLEGLEINPRYFTALPGILKVVEWVLAIICIACAAPALLDYVHWFLFVVVICFIGTFLWMCVHFFTITSILPKFPWQLLETIYSAVATILYFIAMIVMLQQTDHYKPTLTIWWGHSRWEAYITAGVFSLFNTAVYAVETAFHFKGWVDSRRDG